MQVRHRQGLVVVTNFLRHVATHPVPPHARLGTLRGVAKGVGQRVLRACPIWTEGTTQSHCNSKRL